MRSELIIQRTDGSKIKIEVTIYVNADTRYNISLWTCAHRKRTWINISVTDDYRYRNLKFGSKERDDYELNEYLKHVTIEEIQEAANILWVKLKPNFTTYGQII